MGKSLQMITILLGISLVSGLVLGGLNQLTHERAENNILRFKKIPAVIAIEEGVYGKLNEKQRAALEDELLAGKRQVQTENGAPLVFFVLNKDGAPYAVAFDTVTKGFSGGEVGIMTGFDLNANKLVGIGTTTVNQTPGVGMRIKEESFTLQFRGMSLDSTFKVKKDGGVIDAVTGATISSRAAALDITNAVGLYQKYKEQIKRAAQAPPGEQGK